MDPPSLIGLLLLVTPGFAAFYALNYLSPAQRREPSDLQVVLVSLLFSILVLALLALLSASLYVLAAGVWGFPVVAEYLDLTLLVAAGYQTHLAAHPLPTISLTTLWLLAPVALGLWLGRSNPIIWLLERELRPWATPRRTYGSMPSGRTG